MPPKSSALTRFLLATNRFALRLIHDITIDGPPLSLPPSGPAIIASNHTSPLDPLVIQAQTPRHIHWMMASEYMNIPFTSPFWSATGIIPVARNGKDSAGARAALKVLDAGGVLGIFPEGRISTTRDLLPLQPGIGLLASRSNAPLYPVWIEGTQQETSMFGSLFIPQCVKLRFAPPLLPITGSPSPPHQATKTVASLTSALLLLKTP